MANSFSSVVERITSSGIVVGGKTGHGDINLQGSVSDVAVRSGNGHIKLAVNSIPEAGSIDARTGKGDIKVNLPRSTRVLSNLKTGLGEVSTNLGSDPDATFQVDLATGFGDIALRSLAH